MGKKRIVPVAEHFLDDLKGKELCFWAASRGVGAAKVLQAEAPSLLGCLDLLEIRKGLIMVSMVTGRKG